VEKQGGLGPTVITVGSVTRTREENCGAASLL